MGRNRYDDFVRFIFKTSKTLKVMIQNKSKNFEKIAEIYNETVKKIQQLSYIKHRVKKSDICNNMARSCLLGFLRCNCDPNLRSKSET